MFFVYFLKEVQNFFRQYFPQYKVCLFSMWSNAQIVDREYPQGICSPISVVEKFSALFAYPSMILVKNPMSV